MSVYVDDMRAGFGQVGRYGKMIMCHMIADTTEELLAMADRIGVQRKWIQYPGTPKEHFDVCLSKRTLAVRHGAIEINQRDLALRIQQRKESCPKKNENQLPTPTSPSPTGRRLLQSELSV